MMQPDRLAALSSMPKNGLYSLLFNTVIAVLLTAAGFGGNFGTNLLYSQCIGLPAWLLIDSSHHLLWPNQAPRALLFVPIAIAAMLVAWLGGTWLAAYLLGHAWHADHYVASLLVTATAGFIAVLYFWERGRSEMIERQVAEARLKLLQAQIEPHFLFNTLANLDALIGTDPARARAMLGHLNDYLRATLASARKERNTLADEFALLAGYLEIIAVRMGSRLAFSLELPAALETREIPPMLLQPLVENAIRHGLEPKTEGGRVEVRAIEDKAMLEIQVRDTGIGFGGSATSGTGVGLTHVRERLSAAYGPGADCRVEENPGGGAMVTLRIPR